MRPHANATGASAMILFSQTHTDPKIRVYTMVQPIETKWKKGAWKKGVQHGTGTIRLVDVLAIARRVAFPVALHPICVETNPHTARADRMYPGGKTSGPHIVKSLDFSRSKTAIKAFLDQCQQTGGGPFEECYELVLRHAQDLSWRGFNRGLLLIGDAIPHDVNYKDNKTHLNWESELDILTDLQRPGARFPL